MSYLLFGFVLWIILGAFGIDLGIESIPILPIMFGLVFYILCFCDW